MNRIFWKFLIALFVREIPPSFNKFLFFNSFEFFRAVTMTYVTVFFFFHLYDNNVKHFIS